MRRRILQLSCISLLLIILGSHVSELFDQWDHTLQTGNDIESVLVVLALAAGAVLALSGALALFIAAAFPMSALLKKLHACAALPPLTPANHSPPHRIALRI